MYQEDQAAKDDKRARRMRKAKKVARVVNLPLTCFYVWIFLMVVRTGYLSWIGVLVGLAYVSPGVASAVAGFAGKSRLEGFLGWLNIGMPILLGLAVSLAIIWPVDDNGNQWEPYRFEKELAAIETERAIPDLNNAALHCRALFTSLDVNDQPDFFFEGAFADDKFYENPWDGAEHPEAAQWLDGYSEVIDEVVCAASTGTFRWPLQAYTYDDFTVPYEPLSRSVQLLIASANRDLGEGRLDDAITKYFCVIDIGDDLREQLQDLDFRIGSRYERDALRMIRQALVQADLSAWDIAHIGRRLPAADALWPRDGRAFFQAEKLRYMNLLGRLYEVNEKGDIRFTVGFCLSANDPKKDDRWLRIYCPMSMPLDPAKLTTIAEPYFAEFEYLFQSDWLPPATPRREGFWDYAPKMKVNSYRWWAEASFFQEQRYAETRYRCALRVAGRRGTWLVLGLRRYCEANGQWPDSLDRITEYVPAKAFRDPTNQGAFSYVGGAEDFRLYSKGVNGIDEDGRDGYWDVAARTEDDMAIWPPRAPTPGDNVSDEKMLKQLKEIYGDHFRTDKPNEANGV